jgi:hypothetical protein
MSVWPVSLPQYPLTSKYSTTRQNQTIRSEMSVGPPKQRRRFTAGTQTHSISFYVDTTQKAALDTFYLNTLQAGSLSFAWSFFSGDVRFVAPIQYTAITPELFSASFDIEELP